MNRDNKPSDYISRRQAATAIDCVDFAYRQGMALTRFISVNLNRYEHPPRTFIKSFLKLAGEFLAFDGAARAHIWFLEWPPAKSLNAHILVHVPSDMEIAFRRMEIRWARMTGLKIEKCTINRQTLTGEISSGAFLRSSESAVGYCLKGAHPSLCALLGIKAVDQGTIYGKRVGWSQSLGQKARDKAGYQPLPSERGAILFPRRYRLEAGWKQTSSDPAE